MKSHTHKKRLVLSALAVALMGGASSTLAQEKTQEKNWSVSLGLKAWASYWSTFAFNDSSVSGVHNTEWVNDSATGALLPSLTFKYKDFFINAGALQSSDYKFPASSELVCAAANCLLTTQTSAKREEYDINLGWQFSPRAAVTIGYKQMKQKFTSTFSGPGFVATTATSTTTIKIPTIGLLANAPIGDGRWFLYGNGAYGPSLTESFEPSSPTKVHGWFATVETGFGYAFSKNWLGTIGWKSQTLHQKVDMNNGPAQNGDDTTYGLIAGATFVF